MAIALQPNFIIFKNFHTFISWFCLGTKACHKRIGLAFPPSKSLYIIPVVSYLYCALSFYRSQNVLCWLNFFWTNPKIEVDLFSLQKLNLLYGNHLLVLHKKCPTSPNTQKSQILFHKKSPPQDFI